MASVAPLTSSDPPDVTSAASSVPGEDEEMASSVPGEEMASAFTPSKPSAMTLRVESLANVREKVQRKTFTRWVNLSLTPAEQVTDLYEELRTGEKFIRLVNLLAGSSIQPEKGHMEIHHRANIAKALDKLTEVDPQHGISISAIYEGTPKLTLALVWHLILRYSHLHGSIEQGVSADAHCKSWCGRFTDGYAGLENIGRDFLGVWVTGLVLPAIIHRNAPDLIDYRDLHDNKTPEERFELSFDVVESHFGVTQLLDVEDMNRRHVDEQSVVTYLVTLIKAVGETVPELQPEIIAHTAATRAAATGIPMIEEEEREDLHATMEECIIEEDEEEDEDVLTPVADRSLPEIAARQRVGVSAGNGAVAVEIAADEDKDSGLDLEYSPDKVIPREVEVLRADDVTSPRSSTVTLDSESEYTSATSSPIAGRRLPANLALSEEMSVDGEQEDEVDTPNVDTVEELEITLNFLSTLPEHVATTPETMTELSVLLKDRRDGCTSLLRQINNMLSEKQERDKRAELHRLLSTTGRFDTTLQEATNEVAFFNTALETLEKAVARCSEFADTASQRLSEAEVPSSSEGARARLQEQRTLLKSLEEEQRQLEYAFRGLTRSIPQIIPMSVSLQQKDVTAVQNTLSDIEGHLNNSAETLVFLVSRLPSLEQKLSEADEILTTTEDLLDREHRDKEDGEGRDSTVVVGELEDLQLQIDRALTYLNNVNHLFVPMECFGSEFDLEPLRAEWTDLTERAHRSARKVRELMVEEEALSEEVLLILDWAETLKLFLTRRPKPAESREQLAGVAAKWREVRSDLEGKAAEIEELLGSGREQSRVMSPLDKDTLFDLREQLSQLQVAVKQRTVALEEAYVTWGRAEERMTALRAGKSLAALELSTALALPSATTLSGVLREGESLRGNEVTLLRQGASLEALVEDLSLLSPSLVDTPGLQRQRDALFEEHTELCKKSTARRTALQRSAARYQAVFPFLREVHRDTLGWLYASPLLDIETVPDSSSVVLAASVHDQPRPLQYFHAVRTVSPTRLSFVLFNWFIFALGPWGLGAGTDRPFRIFDYTFDVRL